MVDSSVVLTGQTVLYTFYVFVIFFIMGWFAYSITRGGESKGVSPAFFYSFFAFLVILGVSLHLVTYFTIPWKHVDLDRSRVTPDKIINISVKDHKFYLPSERMIIRKNEKVHFKVTSEDLTYGFGVFRQNNSMVFQMQVVPGHMNDIIWEFTTPGVYSIRSTEYSGPKGIAMIEKDVIVVTN